MKYLCNLVLFLLIIPYSFGQTDLKFGKNHLLFFDVQAQEAVLLVNDTILYYGEDFKTKSVTNGLDAAGFSNDPPYILAIGDRTYFVANGAGPVMVYEEGRFLKNDNTFEHRNQHYATPFVYKDDIYLFGGYGLFTHKNMITKYHKNNGGWSQVQTFGDELPSPRFRALSFATDSLLYVFGGLEQDSERFRKHKIVDDGIMWRFDMHDRQWSKEGAYKLELIGERGYVAFQTPDKLYLLDDYIYEVDIFNNSFKTYAFGQWKDIRKIIYDAEEDKVIYTYRRNKKSDIFRIQSEPLDSFIGEEMSQVTLFEKQSNPILIGAGIFTLIIGLGFGTVVYRRKKVDVEESEIVYDSTEGAFYYKNNKISNLNENEFLLLEYLVIQKSFTPLNKLNELFQLDDTESFSAISKRRETTMANLLFKLSTLLQIPKENIIVEQRNPTDRRLKEVKINQELFKLK